MHISLWLQAEHQANAYGTITWNISLFEDYSLWVVPGSNRRPNTAAEQEVFDRPGMDFADLLPGTVELTWPMAVVAVAHIVGQSV